VFFAAMNFGLAAVREALSLWTPTLLVELCRVPTDEAVRASALLPVASGLGALLAGAGADRGPRALLAVTVLPAWLGAAALAALASLAAVAAPDFMLLLVVLAVAAALLMMPMTLASGVLPLRAAPHGGARRLGFVDGAGSLGAVLAGTVLARVQVAWGASTLFATLAAIAALAGALAFAAQRISAPRTPAVPPHR
jgi:sugar phosphate permease